VNTIAKWVAVSALLACPIAANAQAVTYDFTGTIITGSGIYTGDTGTVSGTYTFDFAYNNPALASGTFSTATGGNAENETGTNFTTPPPQTAPGLVFSSTLVGTSGGDVGLAYSSTVGAFSSGSRVLADPTADSAGAQQYSALEANYQTPLSGTGSSLGITGPTCDCQNPLGFSAAGLPVFVSGLTYTGSVGTSVNDAQFGLSFDITSLTPATTAAPEIDPAAAGSALTLLAGFAAMMRGRRRVGFASQVRKYAIQPYESPENPAP
jgi:hypothetical protein